MTSNQKLILPLDSLALRVLKHSNNILDLSGDTPVQLSFANNLDRDTFILAYNQISQKMKNIVCLTTEELKDNTIVEETKLTQEEMKSAALETPIEEEEE